MSKTIFIRRKGEKRFYALNDLREAMFCLWGSVKDFEIFVGEQVTVNDGGSPEELEKELKALMEEKE